MRTTTTKAAEVKRTPKPRPTAADDAVFFEAVRVLGVAEVRRILDGIMAGHAAK